MGFSLAYNNVLEPINITHRTLIRVIIKYFYSIYTNKNVLFQKLNIITSITEIIKIHTNKTVYEIHNGYKIRGAYDGNLRLIKLNTTSMGNYYINRGIKFKLMLKKKYKCKSFTTLFSVSLLL